MNSESFPEDLSKREKDFLFSVLPEDKPGYNKYRSKISNLFVIGPGRFGMTNKVLGPEDEKPDLFQPSAPVFALGEIETKETKIDVIIHEEIDNQIEYDISPRALGKIPEKINEVNRWSYSDWNPGNKAPGDKSFVREIIIIPDYYILAIVPVHKKIWLHEVESGINYIIPVTNFYNQLMIVKNIRDTKRVLDQNYFFNKFEEFSDEELISTFVTYNKYIKRVKLDLKDIEITKKQNPKKKGIFKLFKGKN